MSAGPPGAGPPRDDWLGRLIKWLERRIELITAISLSIATLVTSWSGYEAALWDGRQAAAYSQANSLRTMAARYATRGGQQQVEDVIGFGQWLNAYARREERLQAFLHARFRPEFVPAFDAWVASDPESNPKSPRTPFVMPQYRLKAMERAEELEHLADKRLAAGLEANRIGDTFVAATVVLASALFFGGICQVFDKPRIRVLLAALSVFGCLVGLAKISVLPMLLTPDSPSAAQEVLGVLRRADSGIRPTEGGNVGG